MNYFQFPRLRDFKESLCARFHNAAARTGAVFCALRDMASYNFFCAEVALKEAGYEILLEGEGLLHIAAASDEVKMELKRDVLTCATETGLAVAENVALEVTLAVAAVEAAEKAYHTAPEKRNFLHLAAEFGESVISSTVAALHAGANVFCDLKRSGVEWEAREIRKAHLPVFNALS